MARFRATRIHNFSKQDFERTYDGVTYSIPAGQTISLPDNIAVILAKHLTNREYGEVVKKAKFDRNYRKNKEDWNLLYQRALPDGVPQPEAPAPQPAEPARLSDSAEPVEDAAPEETVPELEPEPQPEPNLEDQVNEVFEKGHA